MMKKPFFTGVCTALVTPFRENTVWWEQLEKLLVRQAEAGIPAVVLSGTTGEAPVLSKEEKLQLIRFRRRLLGGRMQLIAGTGSNDTRTSVALSKAAEDAGADALLVVSPYYNKATESGLIAHYTAVAEAVRIPIILYNVPGRTGLDIPVSVYRELSVISNIAGVKEAGPAVSKISEIRSVCGADFPVWSGNDRDVLSAIALGARGIISVISNLLPVSFSHLVKEALAGRFSDARKQYDALYPLLKGLSRDINPVPIKAALRLSGLDCGSCRLPLTDLSEANKEKLADLLTEIKTGPGSR